MGTKPVVLVHVLTSDCKRVRILVHLIMNDVDQGVETQEIASPQNPITTYFNFFDIAFTAFVSLAISAALADLSFSRISRSCEAAAK